MTEQISKSQDLPELNLSLVVKLGPNNVLIVVWMGSRVVPVSKLLHENSKNHENQGSDIPYMSTLKKIVKILLYQLFMPNKKASLQFLSQRPLKATFGHHIFVQFLHYYHTLHLDGINDLLW